MSSSRPKGALIVNADDWGRDRTTTESILDCCRCGTVSSVSAMVFMEDSRRAAAVAGDANVDAGLHLNFTTPFSEADPPRKLSEHAGKLAKCLRAHRFAPVVYHPGLTSAFEYVVRSQLDEFERLYGRPPSRIDGHHHMHLCANVVLGRLLPQGTVVRRNFYFRRGEKGMLNRAYRGLIDRTLGRRHLLVDYLFDIQPLQEQRRLDEIIALARDRFVELEVHPIRPDEHQFLTGGEMRRRVGDAGIAHSFMIDNEVWRRPADTDVAGAQTRD